MLAVSTPEVINPVADACEAAGVPCLSTVMPWEAWYFGRGAKPGAPSPFKWTYHFGFGVGEFYKTYVSLWNSSVQTNKKVGVLYPNDADGNAIRANLAPLLAKEGFTIIDPGPYEDGTTDYSAQIAHVQAGALRDLQHLPDPAGFRRVLAAGGAAGLHQDGQDLPGREDRAVPVGDRGARRSRHQSLQRLLLAQDLSLQIIAQRCDGHRACRRLRENIGKQWTQQLGASMSLLDAGFEALKASSDPEDKAAVAKALSTLKTTTMVGKVDFTSGPVPNVSPGPIIGAQWVKASGWQQVQAGLRGDRACHRSQCPDRSQADAVLQVDRRLTTGPIP